MKFKFNRVKLIKELGELTLDVFVEEFQKYCDQYMATRNNSKYDISLLRSLCNVLENAYEKKHTVDEKLNKKQVVIDEYIRLKTKHNHTYNADDKKVLNSLIDDLHNTGQIKKVPLIKVWSRRVKNLVKHA